MKILISALCALFLALPALAGQPLPGKSLYHLAGRWTDQSGREISLANLRGEPVVLAMAYTRCKEMCPLTVEAMRHIEQDWYRRSPAPVRFAFFSFDWVGDLPARLRDYAGAHDLDPAHWSLYHGSEASVRELAAALGIGFLRDENGEISHGYAISLLDADGVLVLQQTGVQPDTGEMLDKIASLTPQGR